MRGLGELLGKERHVLRGGGGCAVDEHVDGRAVTGDLDLARHAAVDVLVQKIGVVSGRERPGSVHGRGIALNGLRAVADCWAQEKNIGLVIREAKKVRSSIIGIGGRRNVLYGPHGISGTYNLPLMACAAIK